MGQTAEELRAEAAKHYANERESYERCDTDGFLSQWCSNLSAREASLQADLVEDGGFETYALFTLDGDLVAAKDLKTRYGWRWGVLESDDPYSRVVEWLPWPGSKRHLEKKGYRLGRVKLGLDKVKAALGGSGTGLSGLATCHVYVKRLDGGFSRDVEIVSTDFRKDADDETLTNMALDF